MNNRNNQHQSNKQFKKSDPQPTSAKATPHTSCPMIPTVQPSTLTFPLLNNSSNTKSPTDSAPVPTLSKHVSQENAQKRKYDSDLDDSVVEERVRKELSEYAKKKIERMERRQAWENFSENSSNTNSNSNSLQPANVRQRSSRKKYTQSATQSNSSSMTVREAFGSRTGLVNNQLVQTSLSSVVNTVQTEISKQPSFLERKPSLPFIMMPRPTHPNLKLTSSPFDFFKQSAGALTNSTNSRDANVANAKLIDYLNGLDGYNRK